MAINSLSSCVFGPGSVRQYIYGAWSPTPYASNKTFMYSYESSKFHLSFHLVEIKLQNWTTYFLPVIYLKNALPHLKDVGFFIDVLSIHTPPKYSDVVCTHGIDVMRKISGCICNVNMIKDLSVEAWYMINNILVRSRIYAAHFCGRPLSRMTIRGRLLKHNACQNCSLFAWE